MQKDTVVNALRTKLVPNAYTNREDGHNRAVLAAMSMVSNSYRYQPELSDTERLKDWVGRLSCKTKKDKTPASQGYNEGLRDALAVLARFEMEVYV